MKNNSLYSQNEKGKVRYLMPYTDPMTGKLKRVSVFFAKDTPRNRAEATRILEERIAEKTGMSDADELLLSTAIDRYITFTGRTLKASTLRRNQATMSRVQRLFPPDTRLNSIAPTVWKDRILSISKTNGAYNEYIRRVKAFLRWCYQNDMLDDGKVIDKLGFLPDASRRDKATDKYLEPDEVTRLLDAMQACPRWQLLTEFMILSGLRCGEVLALEIGDLSDDYISVTKTYDENNRIVTSPKTAMSVRQVSIQPELAACIRKIKRWRAGVQLAYGFRTDILFPSIHGTYSSYWGFEKYLKETSVPLFGRKITTHTLRHTCASLLLGSGVPIEVISRRLGHENSRVTKEIYLHKTKKLEESDAAAVAAVRMLS